MCCSRVAGAVCGGSGAPCVYRIYELLFLELKILTAITKGEETYSRRATRIFSMVKSLFQLLTRWSLERSTCIFTKRSSQLLFKTATARCQGLRETDPAILGIDTGEVDPGDEVDNRWLIRVGVSAVNFKAVDAVLMVTLRLKSRSARRSFVHPKYMLTHVRRTKNRSIPV